MEPFFFNRLGKSPFPPWRTGNPKGRHTRAATQLELESWSQMSVSARGWRKRVFASLLGPYHPETACMPKDIVPPPRGSDGRRLWFLVWNPLALCYCWHYCMCVCVCACVSVCVGGEYALEQLPSGIFSHESASKKLEDEHLKNELLHIHDNICAHLHHVQQHSLP